MRTTNNLILFWTGILSNWANTPYKSEGKDWCCSEQQYMWFKATHFGDMDIAAKIMESTNPKEIKRLGRMVQNYDDAEWAIHRAEYMYRAVKAKFTGNEQARKFLLKQPPHHMFAEASPFDTIWGIGFAEDDVRAHSPAYWRGQNLLGILLTQVYNELKWEPNLFDNGYS